MSLGPSAMRCLRDLVADPEGDILADGGAIWCGHRPIARRTLNQLLRCVAVSDASDGGCERYAVRLDLARAIIARPGVADEVESALLGGRPFGLSADGTISFDAAPAPDAITKQKKE